MAENKKVLKRRTSKSQRSIKSKLDEMDDGEVLELFEGVGQYIKDHFVEDGSDDLNEEEKNERTTESSGFAKFFGGE